MAKTPAAEVDVDAELVRRLLREQHPDLAELPLQLVAQGWDNLLWRLGEDLAVRVPRREIAAQLIEHEQEWLPVLAARLQPVTSVAVPVPVRHGVPGAGYPWSWSVVPWIAGRSAATVAPAERAGLAASLAAVVAALHVPAPADAPNNPVRALPLLTRDVPVRDRLDSGGVPRSREVSELWTELSAVEPWRGPRTWLHGDLHPHNLVVHSSGSSDTGPVHLAAVVDFGDMTAGDPATDLATAWLTFDPAGRERFRAALADLAEEGQAMHYDAATWQRARGWALSMATAMTTSSDDAPLIRAVGQHTIDQVLLD